MAATKVRDADLRSYLEAGHSQAEAARHFGVSEPAIHQRLKRMRALTSQVVALEKAGQVVEEMIAACKRRLLWWTSAASNFPQPRRLSEFNLRPVR
jgi:transposase